MAGLIVTQVAASGGMQRTLMDRVTLVTQKTTPFLAMLPKGTQNARGLQDEWPLDDEDDAQDSAQVDAADAGNSSSGQEKYGIMTNRVQWNRRVAEVSTLSGFQNQAGIGTSAKEKMAYAIAKKLKGLAKDIEATLSSEREAVAGAVDTANKTRGAAKFLTTGQSGAFAVPTQFQIGSGQIYSGTLAAFDEVAFNGLLKATWDSGAVEAQQEYVGLCGSAFKARITSLTAYASGTNTYATSRHYNADLKSKIIWSTIDEFRGDFGNVALIPSRWLYHPTFGGSTALNSNSCLGLRIDKWQMVPLEMNSYMDLPNNGGGERKQISSVWTLRCLNPKANWVARIAS
mgnify:CR=1 FL=1|jgi:hypothetical protein